MSTLKFQNKISHRAIKSSFIFAIYRKQKKEKKPARGAVYNFIDVDVDHD